MTGNRLALQDFGAASVAGTSPQASSGPEAGAQGSSGPSEEDRLAAYEDGYKSGWDDAVKADEGKRAELSAELERNLRNLSFSYYEARDEIMGAVRPFLTELMAKLFQDLLPEATAANIVFELSRAAEDACDGEVVVLVAPEDADAVTSLLPASEGMTVSVREEPAMATGQARLMPGSKEISVDVSKLVERLRHALTAIEENATQELAQDVQNG